MQQESYKKIFNKKVLVAMLRLYDTLYSDTIYKNK